MWHKGDDESVPGKRWPDPSILTKYSCPSTIEGTTSEFLFFPGMVMKDAFGEELPPGSGPIFNAPFTPRSVGTSTIRLADFYSGSESMFVTAYEEAVVPVVVGGNITVFPRFCGDANGDDQVDVGDAVHTINYVFKGGQSPAPECYGDANKDGSCDVGDAVYLINYVFKGGPTPVENCCP